MGLVGGGARDVNTVVTEWLLLRDIVRTLLTAGIDPSMSQLEGLAELRQELDRALDRRMTSAG